MKIVDKINQMLKERMQLGIDINNYKAVLLPKDEYNAIKYGHMIHKSNNIDNYILDTDVRLVAFKPYISVTETIFLTEEELQLINLYRTENE